MASYLGHIGFKNIYDYFYGKKQREKLDYILEPFQAMTQLALLSFCPVGSKLTINDNILTIQQPGISQGIIRYFNDDNKEDLYYLMNVFRRFFEYYKFMLDNDDEMEELYSLLIKLSIKGIDKLTETYTNTNKINVLHTLQMYKVVLTNQDFFNNSDINNDTNIDNIFIKISEIYKKEEYIVILNLLSILQKNSESYSNYIDGVNIIMDITNKKIKQWIDKNIL
jgi:hypothetical protein